MTRFDVNAWNYTRQDLEKMAGDWDCFSEALNTPYGGKYLSLKVCELFALYSEQFQVPDWLPVGPSYMTERKLDYLRRWFQRQRVYRLIARSSAPKEDWLDPCSGCYETNELIKNWEAELQRFVGKNGSAVVQRLVRGVGFVVDVGYSRILKKPVVRVAHGRAEYDYDMDGGKGGYYYSSATWDEECDAGIYLIPDGQVYAELPDESEFSPYILSLVKTLVNTMEYTGFEFGMQFELITTSKHLEAGYKPWFLVQARPSPDKVRGMTEDPVLPGRQFALSGNLNKAGVAEGELCALGHLRFQGEGIEDKFQDVGERGSRSKYFEELTSRFQGKIILWDHNFHGLHRSLFCMLGAATCGVVGQLGEYLLTNNWCHAFRYPFIREQIGVHQQLKTCGIQMRISPDESSDLEKKAKSETVKLRLVSDGLVGGIYII